MSEYVSRELFDERGERFMAMLDSDKENIKLLTAIVNRHETAIEKLLMLENRAESDRAEITARMDSEREEFRNSISEIAKLVAEVAAISKDHAGRLEFHASKNRELEVLIKEVDDKPKKKLEDILTHIIKGVLMILAGAVVGYLMHG